jgi:hypothetical protein
MNELQTQNQDLNSKISILKAHKIDLERRLSNFEIKPLFALACSLPGIVYGCYKGEPNLSNISSIARIILLGFFTSFLYLYIVISFRFMYNSRLSSIKRQLVELGADELKENIKNDFFTNLIQINFKYIDLYYLQTQEQAAKSFSLAKWACIAGIGVVVVGIVMMYNSYATPAYVTTAAGVLSEMIAGVFFYLYNRTILKMSQYHQKLVITQNISLALKITEDMEPGERDKVRSTIVDRLTMDINKYLSEIKTN